MTARPSGRDLTSFAAALGMLVCLGASGAAGEAPRPAAHRVVIDGVRFQPGVITVKSGDAVVWVNKDPFPHTATATAGGFDSHEIGPGRSWTYTTARSGNFAYICTLHPTMKATLRVK